MVVYSSTLATRCCSSLPSRVLALLVYSTRSPALQRLTHLRYTHGVNWRAVAAFILALIPSLPGFAAKINTKIKVPIGAKYIFALVWPLGVIVGGVCYLLFSAIWPARSQKLESPKPGKAPSFSSDADLEK
ncbi:NCS1 nucleoside transporter family [Mycena sanguinolenta]|uniref:NCS1 nucleoside transporter family n=1 Tax=Mycena sanguinolenta TaxID=230812 RepID=A0A8H6XL69_9AGAR|nr:NCS1 nucleoside transporter family [Mycena sanguinolenta]